MTDYLTAFLAAFDEWSRGGSHGTGSFIAGWRDALDGAPPPDAGTRRGPDYAAGRRAALAWMAGRERGGRDNEEVTE